MNYKLLTHAILDWVYHRTNRQTSLLYLKDELDWTSHEGFPIRHHVTYGPRNQEPFRRWADIFRLKCLSLSRRKT